MLSEILFSIETNNEISFQNVSIKNFDLELFKKFKLNYPSNIKKIIKSNFQSELYYLEYTNLKIVLRSSHIKWKNILNYQIIALTQIDENKLEFLSDYNGDFVIEHNNQCWVGYKYIEGQQFSGSFDKLLEVFKVSLKFNSQLIKLGNASKEDLKNNYPCVEFNRDNWILGIHNLFNNKNLQTYIKKNILFEIKKLEQTIIKLCNTVELPEVQSFSLVHYDIQHSNIVETPNDFIIIDFEDLCLAPENVAVGQAFFRLLRHCIKNDEYKSREKVDEIRNKMFDLAHKNYGIKQVNLMMGSVIRTLNDVSFITNSLVYRNDDRYIYDINKKLLNILEIPYVFNIDFGKLVNV